MAKLFLDGPLGTSAGGLESLEIFFSTMPADTGMAFVIPQYPSSDFKSLPHELLARHTDMPVQQVRDGMPIGPDHVDVLAPRKEVKFERGKMRLHDKATQNLNFPVNVFSAPWRLN